MTSTDTRLEELNRWMLAHHMHGYWMQTGGGPGAQIKPYLWKWADIHAGLVKAGDLISVGSSGTTRVRTIDLRNPAQGGVPRSISLSPQILMPGERTSAHRILSNEARFMVQAQPGAVLVADGEAFPMEAGDLVVSPAATDHYGYNGGTDPAIWLDGLDVALLSFMGTEVGERDPLGGQQQPVDKPAGFFSGTQDRMKASLRSSTHKRWPARYSWTETYATLMALQEGDAGGDPYDGIHLRYTSPSDGGPTLPTFSCEMQLLPPGFQALAHRHNSSATYHVVRGEGRTEVAGEWLEWTQGDIFCVSPWAWHRHENPARDDAILYSVDDWPAMAKMGFYRKEGAASE